MRKVCLVFIALCFLNVGTSQAQTSQSAARKFDEVSGFNCEDLAAYLDNYAVHLQNEPGMLAYIIVFGGQREQRGAPKMWESRIKHYLTSNRGLDAARIVSTVGGYREQHAAELWMLRPGERKPFAKATIKRADVKFKKGRIKKSWYRQCDEVW